MGTLNYRVIDNFLEKEDFYKFQEEIFNIHTVPWFYRGSQTHESIEDLNDIGYFTLSFFNHLPSDFTNFNYYLFKIYEKLDCKALIQVRANLATISNNKKMYFHTDYDFKCNTAIFYMNTNNGATILDRNEKIKIDSVENRMLIFDSQIEHCALTQSDVKRRIVLNLNYF